MGLFRRNNRQETIAQRFWLLLHRRGDVDAALHLYEKQWASKPEDCPRALRVAYHYHRWLSLGDDTDVIAIEQLARAEPRNSQITRALNMIKRQQYEKTLATTIANRGSRDAIPPAPRTNSERALMLEKLGVAVVEAMQVYNGESAEKLGAIVLRILPDKSKILPQFESLYDHLFIWSKWIQGEQEALFAERKRLEQMRNVDVDGLLLSVSNFSGRAALAKGEFRTALDAIEAARNLTDMNTLVSIVFEWALATIQDENSSSIVAFLENQQIVALFESHENGEFARHLLIMLDYFYSGQYNSGRDAIAMLLKQISDPEAAAQFVYMDTLALIALTASTLSGDSDDEGERLQHQAIWRASHRQLQENLNKLDTIEGVNRWRYDLLLGLLAYADRSTILEKDKIEDLGRAIEHVADEASQPRIRTMQVTLRNRALAVESAIGYIQNQDYASLRIFADTLLRSLGDAIPPLIKAAIYLMLWEDDPNYDPLPDLQRIPSSPETQRLIDRAIQQVQVRKTIEQLTLLCLNVQQDKTQVLPIMAVLRDNEIASALGQFAVNVIHLQRGEWQQLRKADLSQIPDLIHEEQFVRFYAAWESADTNTSNAIMDEAPDNPYLQRYRNLIDSLKSRRILIAMENGQRDIVSEEIWTNHLDRNTDSAQSILRWTLNLGSWLLIEERAPALQTLIDTLRADSETYDISYGELDWVLHLLSGLVAAQLNKYTLAAESFDNVLSHDYQPPDELIMLVTWSRLARLLAELGRAAYATDDLNLQWPSIYRNIVSHINELPTTPQTVLGYGHLIAGMIKYLTSGAVVDDATINSLKIAQRLLVLQSREQFLAEVVSRLQWRKNVVDEFWNAMRTAKWSEARSIYNDQLLSLFGQNLPHTFEVAMLIVDWRMGSVSMEELQRRLNSILQRHPEMQDMLTKMSDLMISHERVRILADSVKKRDFDAVIKQINEHWRGDIKQATPPEQLAILTAYVSKEKHEEANKLLPHSQNWQGGWQSDFRNLIAGHVYHSLEAYDAAAEAFSQINAHKISNKDRNRLWALSRFQRGMELLKAGKQTEALNQILAYLRENRSENESEILLSRTLLYFGYQKIKDYSGNYALEAFTKAHELATKANAMNPQIFHYDMIAQIGRLLTLSLMKGDDVEPVTRENFHRLADELLNSRFYHPNHHFNLLVALYRMMIARMIQQTRVALAEAENDEARQQLVIEFQEQLQVDLVQLEDTLKQTRSADAIALLLNALNLSKLQSPPDLLKAIELLDIVINKLGEQSQSVKKLLNELMERVSEEKKLKDKLFTLIEQYVLSGSTYDKKKMNWLAKDNALHGIMQLNRQITPRDLPDLRVHNELTILKARIEHLHDWIDSSSLDGDTLKQYVELSAELKAKIIKLEELRKDIDRTERKILKLATKRLKEQN